MIINGNLSKAQENEPKCEINEGWVSVFTVRKEKRSFLIGECSNLAYMGTNIGPGQWDQPTDQT